ncbi:adenine phosphoribosyltransferase [Phytoactinopolyspora mesophila]|uniref:Adenine phosphoribosyltransferase n=1 Tax=Phytoactinopolyspora mesophila TaxID=2650750 RepID=A0A7K3LYB6_9ACTN|nr:adenine phosphoribosyltransferase [Phytoactinopolyspora mesophila]NDL56006.1 adenine phosphoribosyltransferase [Phytoactinopolyspora mesophila]
MPTADQRELLLSGIRDVPDWPEPGIVFKDITPLLRNPAAFGAAVDLLAGIGDTGSGYDGLDAVVGIEARGFILGAPVAQRLGVGFVPVRKEGKLPSRTSSASYELEYGRETVEMHRDALSPGDTVLIVDDVLATGGTARATIDLVRGAGAQVAGVSVLMELGFLNGREKLRDVTLTALLSL